MGTDFDLQNLLPQRFYARDAAIVAQDLLGKYIVVHDVAVRITETEAYCWPDDSANHSFKGKTERNASMWGPPGHAYVYLCYGLHNMLNFVTNDDGQPAAVLIRSVDVVFGQNVIEKRRGSSDLRTLLNGPGKVGQALAVDRDFCHQPLFSGNGIKVFDGPSVTDMLVGARIGIDYAAPKDRGAPLRFADGQSRSVSHRSKLAFKRERN